MAKAAAQPQVLVALASFVGGIGNVDVAITRGELFASDDPAVQKWPELFGPVVVRRSVLEPRIETATAAPGEKRGA